MIMKHFGEINYYVHEALDEPLVVTDDDLSGSFTFARAMPDYGNSLELTPKRDQSGDSPGDIGKIDGTVRPIGSRRWGRSSNLRDQ